MTDSGEALPQPARRRPFGVYVIIALQLLIVMSNWVDVLRAQLDLSPLMLPELADERLTEALTIGITVVVILVAIGLWALKRWAWYATMLMQGAALLYGIWLYFTGGEPYLSLLLNAVVVFYLNQSDVQRCFARPQAEVAVNEAPSLALADLNPDGQADSAGPPE